jgi:hypothetical protein
MKFVRYDAGYHRSTSTLGFRWTIDGFDIFTLSPMLYRRVSALCNKSNHALGSELSTIVLATLNMPPTPCAIETSTSGT